MLADYIKLFFFRREFRKKNSHNLTHAINIFNLCHVEIGKWTYGGIQINDWGKEDYKVKIGNYCSIGPNVLFLLGSNHNLDTLTTYPLKVKKIKSESYEAWSKGDIILADDVWIGANVTICSGVNIGQGAVIAAGAVVTKNIPPYAIAGGVPAKIIKFRFSPVIVEKLLMTSVSSLLDKSKKENIDFFYDKITEENIDDLLKKIKGR